jgi:hypothetical protein
MLDAEKAIMARKRAVERARLAQEPYLLWNAFIDLLATEEYGDLSSTQRKAHLVFWYDSELQNGGHGQYFENRGRNRLDETVAALRDLGLLCQAEVLARAAAAFDAAEPTEDWADVLHDDFIDELDAAFDRCTPSVTEALEQHLARHADEYVEYK